MHPMLCAFRSSRGALLSLLSWFIVAFVSTSYSQTGAPLPTTTTSQYWWSNQSKLFYHDGTWWAIAFQEPLGAWFLWKYNGVKWTREINIQAAEVNKLDLEFDSAASKLYVIASNSTGPRLRRYSYSAGVWTKDPGFPLKLSDFKNADNNNPLSLVKGKDGTIWLFRIHASQLQTKFSTNGGTTWSSVITIASGLNQPTGSTDCVAFTEGADNYVGVGYGETGAINSEFGFWLHRDGDDSTTWTDESSQLTFFNNETARNVLNMTVDDNNQVYMFVRTLNGAAPGARNILYKRVPGSGWSKSAVNTIASGINWLSPVMAIDDENSLLYLIGRDNGNGKVQYKTARIGIEGSLASAPVQTLMESGAELFGQVSSPSHHVNSTSDLMVTAGNNTTDDLWFSMLSISAPESLMVNSVTVSPNGANQDALYALELILSEAGGLVATFDTIAVRFPNDTSVPPAILASNANVDGVAASNVITVPLSRTVKVVPSANVAGGDTISLNLAVAAGIVNPTVLGTYTLEAWTSAQTEPATSPAYDIVEAVSTVTSANVSPFPSEADSASQYTIGFRAGFAGSLISGSSTVTLSFPTNTQVDNGALAGVKINGVAATATGNSVARSINMTLPASVTIGNNDSVTVLVPSTLLINPSYPDTFNLTVSTSVETIPVASQGYLIHIGRPVAGTTANFERENQSKVFFYDGFWWLAAQDKNDKHWYLWKRSDTTWTRDIEISSNSKVRPDCILDEPHDKLYALLPGESTARITRLDYDDGEWDVDNDFPADVVSVQYSSMNLARALNGDLWVFWLNDSTLFARRSSDSGKNWNATVTVKDSLMDNSGLTDAVAFAFSGQNYVGVGYAENNGPGSLYGFLRHQDGANDTLWTDESEDVPQFNNTHSDDHTSMLVHQNEIFMIVKTAGGGGSTTTKNALLHRQTDGDWNDYDIIQNNGWTRPTLAIDATNERLYVFGIREGSVKVGEMKKVALDDYDELLSASIDTIFQSGANEFFEPSAPPHVVTGITDLLVCLSNEDRNEVWTQFIPIAGGAAKRPAGSNEAQIAETTVTSAGSVKVYPNPFNPETQIVYTLKESAPVKLQIFSLTGQLVRTLVDEELPAGTHHSRWRARNEYGQVVSSGMYFYRLQIGKDTTVGRLHFIK